MHRYIGIPRIDYNKSLGNTRVINIDYIIRNLGFETETRHVESKDVDIWVKQNSILKVVIECINYCRTSYMCSKKLRSVRDNFRKYNCYKLLIVSFDYNYRNSSSYIDFDVDIITIGYQTNPFYEDLEPLGLTEGMKPFEEIDHEVELITEYLELKGLI